MLDIAKITTVDNIPIIRARDLAICKARAYNSCCEEKDIDGFTFAIELTEKTGEGFLGITEEEIEEVEDAMIGLATKQRVAVHGMLEQ